ncbi:response regulator [Mangrovibacillus sp. Mu-81]|jgi:two-component system, NarL family, response regulator DesR|uniref:response regulator n=1 Tax=Mangrovibacillus sp. Mu-81 TaxID=3121478 RepID=UPI002FE4A514
MIRIVIAEDQELMLGTIGSLLDLEDDMEVVGLVSDGEEAVEAVGRLHPDICIMDLEMPRKDGLEAALALKDSVSKVIILTTFPGQGYYERVLKADVKGFLLKDSPSEELISSIRKIMGDSRIYASELIDEKSNAQLNEEDAISLIKDAPPIEPKSYFSTLINRMKLPAG